MTMIGNRSSNFLDQAILDCRFQQLKYAFRNDVDLSKLRTRDGISPLVPALKICDDNQRRKMFNFFLQRGAVLAEKDPKTGRDVLAWACCLGREEQVKRLLEYAPGEFDLRHPDNEGLLPLHHLVRSGNPFSVYQVVREMRKYSMSVDVPNPEGLTPFLEAKRLGYELISQILVKTGNANPTQFDTRTFRTKTRWSEVGQNEREEQSMKEMIGEIKITGSNRPHTAYYMRKDYCFNVRTKLASTRSSCGVDANGAISRPNTSPETFRAQKADGKELYADLHILDLQDVVDGKTSVEDIRRAKLNETESDDSSQQNGIQYGRRDHLLGRQYNGRPQVWSKLSSLMSLSEKASGMTTDAFANSVPVIREEQPQQAPNREQQSGHDAILTSMMTSLAQQMSSAFRKTVVPKPKVVAKPSPPPPPKKKKGSTLAFILKTIPNKKRAPPNRNSQHFRRASVSFKPMNIPSIQGKPNGQPVKRKENKLFPRYSQITMSAKSTLPLIRAK